MLLSRIRNSILGILLIYGLLVATHEGEFWPFSTYQMFSQGGIPWSKPLLVEMDEEACRHAQFAGLEELDGKSIGLNQYGIDHRDFSNFARHLSAPTDRELAALRNLLHPVIENHTSGICVIYADAFSDGNSINLTLSPGMFIDRHKTITLEEQP